MRWPSSADHWVPPLPLVAGLLFQGAAWLIVVAYGVAPSPGLAYAWIHAVALGWITVVALAVLLHVVPSFTDLPWRGERIARGAVPVIALAAAALVAAFAAGTTHVLAAAGGVLALAILVYVALGLRTLAQPAPDRTSRAIARALSLTLGALALTALLGAWLAGAYGRGDGRVLAIAPAHALLGIGGWLSVLVSGVSARTFRPMLGARTRGTAAHIVAGSGIFFGSLVAAIGAVSTLVVLRIGVAILVVGALAYALDALDVVRRAATPNRPAFAFVVAAIGWLVVATVCLAASAAGGAFAALAVVAALAGWIGQMVNAHLHHIGVRVVLTLLRGDEDETRPAEVLDPRLGWTAFWLAQLAVAGTFGGVASGQGWPFVAAGACGLGALAAMAANLRSVRRSASALPIVLS